MNSGSLRWTLQAVGLVALVLLFGPMSTASAQSASPFAQCRAEALDKKVSRCVRRIGECTSAGECVQTTACAPANSGCERSIYWGHHLIGSDVRYCDRSDPDNRSEHLEDVVSRICAGLSREVPAVSSTPSTPSTFSAPPAGTPRADNSGPSAAGIALGVGLGIGALQILERMFGDRQPQDALPADSRWQSIAGRCLYSSGRTDYFTRSRATEERRASLCRCAATNALSLLEPAEVDVLAGAQSEWHRIQMSRLARVFETCGARPEEQADMAEISDRHAQAQDSTMGQTAPASTLSVTNTCSQSVVVYASTADSGGFLGAALAPGETRRFTWGVRPNASTFFMVSRPMARDTSRVEVFDAAFARAELMERVHKRRASLPLQSVRLPPIDAVAFASSVRCL